MSQVPSQFDNVSVVCKANVYFDGKVISHSVVFPDGTKKTLGLIYPGTYTFNTGAPECMEIVAGVCPREDRRRERLARVWRGHLFRRSRPVLLRDRRRERRCGIRLFVQVDGHFGRTPIHG